ncbi:MAG TPA: hypothetical protein VM942_06580, partial [Acidimicrobiales bacterium]|nr:hypothetical protein [Acidimicrobiales bacterium]
MTTEFPRRWAMVAGVALMLVAGAGCGDDSSSTSDDTTATTASGASSPSTAPSVATSSPSTQTADTTEGACKYVTTAEAAALAGSPVKPGVPRSLTTGPVPFAYCDFIFDPGNAPGVTIAVADLQGNGSGLFDQFRQSESSESDYQEVTGVGDEAFFAGTNLNVRKGDTGLILFV